MKKKNFAKMLALVLVAALMIAALTACGQEAPDNSSPPETSDGGQGNAEQTTINFWHHYSAPLALDRVHSVENKMLEYLSNAQGAMQNLYQIKRAGELVTTEIPKNCALLTKSVGRNLKGTAIAAIVSDELTDAATQMAALYPFMKQLVTSGSYNIPDGDGKNEKHKVNLLNSSERYYIANEVVTRLEAINTDLFILAWQVRTLSWNDLWFSLDPEGWASVMSGKNIIDGIVSEWNQGYLLKW